jgi:hypothetical protein
MNLQNLRIELLPSDNVHSIIVSTIDSYLEDCRGISQSDKCALFDILLDIVENGIKWLSFSEKRCVSEMTATVPISDDKTITVTVEVIVANTSDNFVWINDSDDG